MAQAKAEQLINELLGLHPKGFDLSLGRICALLARLDNPQDKLPPIIHIAGTNGKGSASAFCRALLESAGYSVHVHTSPHLIHWHERYRLGQKGGGRYVDDATFADAIMRVAKENGNQPITVFEILSAVAFVLFSEHPADAVILEVGLGGRFDATNVIQKAACSLIMPIALDHEAFLGNSVEKIAFEKAGIIKPKCPVVIGYQENDAARDVLITQAEKNHAPYKTYGQDYAARLEHGRMVFEDEQGLLDLPCPALPGLHQLSNAAAAIEAVRQAGFHLSDQAINQAMQKVEWPARMQRLKSGKLVNLAAKNSEIWLDGGHNPAGGEAIARLLRTLPPRPLLMICGMINTKDSTGYFKAFQGLPDMVLTVPIASSDSAVPPEYLANMAKKAGLKASAIDSLEDALAKSHHFSHAPRVLICGSLYLAGEVLCQNETFLE